jgi:site-specific DNA recombinase
MFTKHQRVLLFRAKRPKGQKGGEKVTIRVIAYYRVSTPQQAERESIEIQKMEREEDFLTLGDDYELVGEYQDDGISGEEIDKRPGFQETLDRIRQGDVDILWV